MYRFISFFVIFSFVSVMLYFHQQNGHYSSSGHSILHNQEFIEIPQSHTVPTIKGAITQNSSGTWLLEIITDHFSFTPKKIGSDKVNYNEGHAHLYMNGEKVNRIYGNYYNLDYLSPGTYQFKVTLNGNNHGVFTHNGEEIAFTQTLIIPKQDESS